MARRQLQEINAGSMADIAFLLLIFFLVTTTMDVDAGIGRQLPLKRPDDPNQPQIEIHDRDILQIKANSKDELLVEGERTDIDNLEKIVMDFYTANVNGERDASMPRYSLITIPVCQKWISDLTLKAEEFPDDIYYKDELAKWKTKMALCNELPGGQYDEIAKMSMIRIENQAGTTYGLYIQIHNILKRVVNELRAEKCDEYWGRDFYSLDEEEPDDADIIKKLRILIPERIVEAKIEK